jgi:hypothetical protein
MGQEQRGLLETSKLCYDLIDNPTVGKSVFDQWDERKQGKTCVAQWDQRLDGGDKQTGPE